MLRFQRTNKIIGIPRWYLPAGFRPGRYKVLSQAVQSVQGYPTVIGYVLLHKGKLVRSWLS